MADKQAEAVAPPTYNDAIQHPNASYPKQPGTNPGMVQPPYPTQPGVNPGYPPYPQQQGGIAPYAQPGQPAYPPGVSNLRQLVLFHRVLLFVI